MKKFTFAALALAVLAALGTVGPVQRAISQGMQNFTGLVGTEQISLNYPCTVSCYVTSAQLAGFGQSQVGNNPENALVAGDATNNLFQRGTSVVIASPAAVAYTADRWFAWGGTNTPVTVAQDLTTPSPNFGASYKVTKASGAGVVQVCVGQEVETVNSYRFQGQTAEFDIHLQALAGFSAVSSNIAIYILTGTSSDEGSVAAAFSINAGGGGGAGWTGGAVLGGTPGYLIPITTTWGRYTVAAPIPLTATEIAVAVCYTPVGTGGATDGFRFAGAQLVPNSALTALAGANGARITTAGLAKSFLRRPQAQETDLQLRYSWLAVNEAASTAAVFGYCAGTGTTAAHCYFAFPVPMRAAPATTFGSVAAGTLVADVETAGAADTVTGVALTASVNTVSGADITLTFAGSAVAGVTGRLRGGNSTGGGKVLFSSEL